MAQLRFSCFSFRRRKYLSKPLHRFSYLVNSGSTNFYLLFRVGCWWVVLLLYLYKLGWLKISTIFTFFPLFLVVIYSIYLLCISIIPLIFPQLPSLFSPPLKCTVDFRVILDIEGAKIEDSRFSNSLGAM